MAGQAGTERAADRGRGGVPGHIAHAMMRRRFMLLAGSGLLVPLAPIHPAQATPAQVAALIAELVGDAALHDARVKLDLPVMVENGNSVGMTVSVDAPVGDVRSIDVFAEGNPLPHVLRVRFGPH